MSNLNHDAFAAELNTPFRVRVNNQDVELQLVEVQQYAPRETEQKGMERFAVYFDGPVGQHLPQATYEVSHPVLGEFALFLVPISRGDQNFRYEAVFNYYKKPED
jgi:hypothetical protein